MSHRTAKSSKPSESSSKIKDGIDKSNHVPCLSEADLLSKRSPITIEDVLKLDKATESEKPYENPLHNFVYMFRLPMSS